jgi:5-methylcytosine-specific restriction protein A
VADVYPFKVGTQYTRQAIFGLLGIPDPGGGNWYTGYNSHGDDWFIFCGVGTPGRTGHDYKNHFRGDELVWYGKTGSHLDQPSIQDLIKPSGHVYIFYREDNRSPFTFAGLGLPKQKRDVSPVEVVWSFATDPAAHPEILPEEITELKRYSKVRRSRSPSTSTSAIPTPAASVLSIGVPRAPSAALNS